MSEDTSGTDTIVELSEEQLTPIIEAAVEAAVEKAIEPLVTTKVTSYLEDMQPLAAQPKEKEVKGRDFSRIVQALAANKGSPKMAVPWAEKRWGDAADQVVKALQASEDETGGFLVPEDMAADVIELLRAQSVVMQSQPMTVPMPSGNLTMPRLASGTAANYIGESEDIGATGVRFDNVRLSARKLAALVPISNDLLRFASPSVDAIVRDDLVQSMSLRMDIAFLRGAGTEQSPRGLLSRAPRRQRDRHVRLPEHQPGPP